MGEIEHETAEANVAQSAADRGFALNPHDWSHAGRAATMAAPVGKVWMLGGGHARG